MVPITCIPMPILELAVTLLPAYIPQVAPLMGPLTLIPVPDVSDVAITLPAFIP